MDNPASQFLRAPAGSTRSPGDYSPSRTRRPVGDFGLVPKSPPQGAAAPMALAFARCYPASLPWLRGSGLASPRRPAGTFTPFRWDGGSIPPADREVWWRRGESNPRPRALHPEHLRACPAFRSRPFASDRREASGPARFDLAAERPGRGLLAASSLGYALTRSRERGPARRAPS